MVFKSRFKKKFYHTFEQICLDPQKSHLLFRFFKSSRDKTCNELDFLIRKKIAIATDPALFHVFSYWLTSKQPLLFECFFDSLLLNAPLYDYLKYHYGYMTDMDFDTFLLQAAESFPQESSRGFALGVLGILPESRKISENFEK